MDFRGAQTNGGPVPLPGMIAARTAPAVPVAPVTETAPPAVPVAPVTSSSTPQADPRLIGIVVLIVVLIGLVVTVPAASWWALVSFLGQVAIYALYVAAALVALLFAAVALSSKSTPEPEPTPETTPEPTPSSVSGWVLVGFGTLMFACVAADVNRGLTSRRTRTR